MTGLNLLRDGTAKLIEDGYTLPLIDNEGILELIARITELEATIQRVRDLHKPWFFDPNYCTDCVSDWGESAQYPCPTIQTLGDQK